MFGYPPQHSIEISLPASMVRIEDMKAADSLQILLTIRKVINTINEEKKEETIE